MADQTGEPTPTDRSRTSAPPPRGGPNLAHAWRKGYYLGSAAPLKCMWCGAEAGADALEADIDRDDRHPACHLRVVKLPPEDTLSPES